MSGKQKSGIGQKKRADATFKNIREINLSEMYAGTPGVWIYPL
jgi:hypothetical protein